MRYTTITDAKTYLGISGSTLDNFLAMAVKSAEDSLDSLLSVNRLDLHGVDDEVHDANGGIRTVYLKDLHVVEIGTILDDTVTYTQDDPYDVDNYVLYLEKSLGRGTRKAKIDYAAGWNAAGMAKITVSDYSTISAGMTIDADPAGADPNVLTEGTEWDAATSNAATATSIAAAINLAAKTGEDTATGIRAFALDAVVYVVDEMPGRETSTLTMSHVTGISAASGGGTAAAAAAALTMDGEDMPFDLIEALYLLIGDRVNRRKSAGVGSYKIGSKSVTYDTTKSMNEVKSKLKAYQRARVLAI
jgi:hypothetical protein